MCAGFVLPLKSQAEPPHSLQRFARSGAACKHFPAFCARSGIGIPDMQQTALKMQIRACYDGIASPVILP